MPYLSLPNTSMLRSEFIQRTGALTGGLIVGNGLLKSFAAGKEDLSYDGEPQPASNVLTGATTACCVHLANQAVYGHSIEKWSSNFNFL